MAIPSRSSTPKHKVKVDADRCVERPLHGARGAEITLGTAVSVYKGADPARKMEILVYALCAV